MKRSNMKLVAGIFAVLLLSASMNGCQSVKQLQENGPNGFEDKLKLTEFYDPSTQDDGPIVMEEVKTISPKQMYMMGEEVTELDVDNGKAIWDATAYTIRKATVYTDIVEAGISQDAMGDLSIDESFCDENGEVKPGVRFLVVEFTAENIRALPEHTVSSFELQYADTPKEITDKEWEFDFFVLPYPDYFSNPGGKRVGEDWVEYYDFRLPVGESKDMAVGWYIDTEQYDLSNLYMVFEPYEESAKYVRLEIG